MRGERKEPGAPHLLFSDQLTACVPADSMYQRPEHVLGFIKAELIQVQTVAAVVLKRLMENIAEDPRRFIEL